MVDNSRIVLLVVVNVDLIDLAVDHLEEAAATFCNIVKVFIVQRKSLQIQDV